MWKKIFSILVLSLTIGLLAGCEKEPEVCNVEITMENWEQYFDLVTEQEVLRDSFGDIYDVKENLIVRLKDDYKLAEDAGTEIAIEVTCTYNEYVVLSMDEESGELQLGDLKLTKGDYVRISSITSAETNLTDESMNSIGKGGVPVSYARYEMPEVTRIQGNLSYVIEWE